MFRRNAFKNAIQEVLARFNLGVPQDQGAEDVSNERYKVHQTSLLTYLGGANDAARTIAFPSLAAPGEGKAWMFRSGQWVKGESALTSTQWTLVDNAAAPTVTRRITAVEQTATGGRNLHHAIVAFPGFDWPDNKPVLARCEAAGPQTNISLIFEGQVFVREV